MNEPEAVPGRSEVPRAVRDGFGDLGRRQHRTVKEEPGGYYGPSRWFGLVGPTTTVQPPRRARDTAAATRLWAEAERLTGVMLPASTWPRTLTSRRA